MAVQRERGSDYRIALGKEGPNGVPEIIMWTVYKGHNFEGWISNKNFARAERDGVLSWDENGKPVIKESLVAKPVAAIQREAAWG